MKLQISNSDHQDTRIAVESALQEITTPPSLILVYQTCNHDPEVIKSIIQKKFPTAPVAGGTTAQGLITEGKVVSNNYFALSLTSFYCEKDEFIGVGTAQDSNGQECGKKSAKQSAFNSGETGILPSFIWSILSIGHEEDMLKGVNSYFGQNIPIYGGTVADNDNTEKWFIYNNEETFKSGALIISFYTNLVNTPSSLFYSGYSPIKSLGKVTCSSFHKIKSIDNKPAVDIYNENTDNLLYKYTEGKNDLVLTSKFPIGRIKNVTHGIPFYLLTHPYIKKFPAEDNSLNLFTNIEDREEIFLMRGEPESLDKRINHVLKSLLFSNSSKTKCISGALIVLCAVTIIKLNKVNALSSISSMIQESLGEIPFLCIFSLGEQGQFCDKENLHGNLMISATLFFKDGESKK